MADPLERLRKVGSLLERVRNTTSRLGAIAPPESPAAAHIFARMTNVAAEVVRLADTPTEDLALDDLARLLEDLDQLSSEYARHVAN